MSSKCYTPEFKDEAERQVVYRGYSVANSASRPIVCAIGSRRSSPIKPTNTPPSWLKPRAKFSNSPCGDANPKHRSWSTPTEAPSMVAMTGYETVASSVQFSGQLPGDPIDLAYGFPKRMAAALSS
jgi:hypothetical protein